MKLKRSLEIIVVLALVSCFICSAALFAQERVDTRESAEEHYRQGKAFYSQGRYQEATEEFEKGIKLISPSRIEFMKETGRTTEEALVPAVPGRPKPQALPKEKLPTEELEEEVRAREKEKEKEEEEEEQEEEEAPGETRETEQTEIWQRLAAPQPTVALEEQAYYIDVGDVFEISVWQLPTSKESLIRKQERQEAAGQGKKEEDKEEDVEQYYIDIGDVLDISVWQVSDLSRKEVIVRPDGKLSFPLIGDIKAEGRSLTQLDELITKELKEYLKEPQVSIMIRKFGAHPEKLAALGDLSRPNVIVRPDGKLSYPLIGDIKAYGLTLPQLDDIITERLQPYVKNPEVSIMIRKFGENPNKVVVLGEIFRPGVYKFNAPPTIAEVMASCGGYSKYAVLESIMVISGDVQSQPQVSRVNFARVIKKGDLSKNVALKPNDIVYVPRSYIGKLNNFLELFQPAFSNYLQTLNARYLHNTIHDADDN